MLRRVCEKRRAPEAAGVATAHPVAGELLVKCDEHEVGESARRRGWDKFPDGCDVVGAVAPSRRRLVETRIDAGNTTYIAIQIATHITT